MEVGLIAAIICAVAAVIAVAAWVYRVESMLDVEPGVYAIVADRRTGERQVFTAGVYRLNLLKQHMCGWVSEHPLPLVVECDCVMLADGTAVSLALVAELTFDETGVVSRRHKNALAAFAAPEGWFDSLVLFTRVNLAVETEHASADSLLMYGTGFIEDMMRASINDVTKRYGYTATDVRVSFTPVVGYADDLWSIVDVAADAQAQVAAQVARRKKDAFEHVVDTTLSLRRELAACGVEVSADAALSAAVSLETNGDYRFRGVGDVKEDL